MLIYALDSKKNKRKIYTEKKKKKVSITKKRKLKKNIKRNWRRQKIS